ncbi:MAG: LytTR family DNA-binding domain-containing protein, partial [Bacteroidota bacterium]
KSLKHPPKIFVTSAYLEYSLEGFDLYVVDYILKPFSLPRFLKAINKAGETVQAAAPELPQTNHIEGGSFFLKGDKKHHQIHPADILFVEAAGNYAKVFLQDEMILSHEKISNLERLLPADRFLRVHKSFIVATAKIKLIQGNQILIQDYSIPIGQTYRSRINALLSGK